MKFLKIGTVELNLSAVSSSKTEFKKKCKGLNLGVSLDEAWEKVKEAKKK